MLGTQNFKLGINNEDRNEDENSRNFTKIVGGEVVQENEIPWLVKVLVIDDTEIFQFSLSNNNIRRVVTIRLNHFGGIRPNIWGFWMWF